MWSKQVCSIVWIHWRSPTTILLALKWVISEVSHNNSGRWGERQYWQLVYYLSNHLFCFGIPVKMLLQDLTRKGPFFLHSCKIFQHLARFCGILWDFRNIAGILHEFCARFLQDYCKITGSCKILQECKKKNLFL